MRKIRNNQANRMSWEGETPPILTPGFTIPDSEHLADETQRYGATARGKLLGHAKGKKPW